MFFKKKKKLTALCTKNLEYSRKNVKLERTNTFVFMERSFLNKIYFLLHVLGHLKTAIVLYVYVNDIQRVKWRYGDTFKLRTGCVEFFGVFMLDVISYTRMQSFRQ